MESNQTKHKQTFTPKPTQLYYLSGFMIVWALFAVLCKGGPNSSDISWYFHVGQNNIADPFILNRYFHVLLLNLFVTLSSNALVGFQLFWSFLLALTTVLVFWSATNFSSTSTFLNGFVAVILFLSLPALAHISGVPYVDVTAMAVVLVLITLYLSSRQNQHNNKILLLAMGLFLFFGLKTKETLLPIAIIFIGLASENNKLVSRSIFIRRFGCLLWGFLLGIILFIIVNAVLYSDPFFGFNIADINKYLIDYAKGTSLSPNTQIVEDWYVGYLFIYALVPFTLTLYSGIKSTSHPDFGRLVIWLAPFTYIITLILSINNKWGFQSRFIIPILPIFCILGAQAVEVARDQLLSRVRNLFFYLGFTIITVTLFGLPIVFADWDFVTLAINYKLVLFPLMLSLLYMLIMFNNRNDGVRFSFYILVILISILPIGSNINKMVIQQANYNDFKKTTFPLTEIYKNGCVAPNTHIFIEQVILTKAPLPILKNADEVFIMFNIISGENLQRSNFLISGSIESALKETPFESFNCLLIEKSSLVTLQAHVPVKRLLTTTYTLIENAELDFVLLKRINN